MSHQPRRPRPLHSHFEPDHLAKVIKLAAKFAACVEDDAAWDVIFAAQAQMTRDLVERDVDAALEPAEAARAVKGRAKTLRERFLAAAARKKRGDDDDDGGEGGGGEELEVPPRKEQH